MNKLKRTGLAGLLMLAASFAAADNQVPTTPQGLGAMYDGAQGQGGVTVDAGNGGATKPKWDFSKVKTQNGSGFDDASKSLGKEAGIDKIEPKIEEKKKEDEGSKWSWGNAAKLYDSVY